MSADDRIGPLTGAESADVLKVWEDVYAKSGDVIGSRPWDLPAIETALKTGHSMGLWRQGRLESFILARKVGDNLEILQLATNPSLWGRGIMKRVLENFLAHGLRTGKVWLEVHASNAAARGLYESFGFVESGRRPKYYQDGGDAILFSR